MMKFIDKLRKVTNGSDADDRVIDECVAVIKKFKPDAFTKIPHNVKDKLMNAARHQEHSCTFDRSDYCSFLKTYDVTNPKMSPKMIKRIKNIVQKAEYNSLFTVEKAHNSVILKWKYLDNDCRFEYYEEYGDLEIYIKFGLDTCAKILEKAGFNVKFSSCKQTLKVEW